MDDIEKEGQVENHQQQQKERERKKKEGEGTLADEQRDRVVDEDTYALQYDEEADTFLHTKKESTVSLWSHLKTLTSSFELGDQNRPLRTQDGKDEGHGADTASDSQSVSLLLDTTEVSALVQTWSLQSLIRSCDSFWHRLMFQNTSVLLFVVGVVSAVIAWVFDEVVDVTMQLKYRYFQNLKQHNETLFYITYGLFHISAALLAVLLTKHISPVAIGSGIPQIKSVLAGFVIKDYLSIRTFFAKIFGLLLALLAGYVIGTEGPFLHTSCIVAFNLAKTLPGFSELSKNKVIIKQLLAAASAVGVSSCFGTPIGGVLFSIEVTSNYYHVDEYWKGFFCAVCASVTFKELSYFSRTRKSVVSLFTTDFDALPYAFGELPGFILLSICCGLAGGCFIRTYEVISILHRKQRWYTIRLSETYSRHVKINNSYIFALGVILLTLLLNFLGGDLMYVPLRNVVNDLFTSQDIKDEFSVGNWENPSLIVNLLKFTIFKFILAAAANNVGIPCGIFTPVFAIGAALGRSFGEVLHYFFGDTLAAGYALVGAAAFTAGVTGTVSTAVIVFELTSQLSYMLPVLLAVLLGKSSALYVSKHFIYDSLARSRKLPSLPRLTNQNAYRMTLKEFYRTEAEHFQTVPRFLTNEQLGFILRQYQRKDHFEYAIVDHIEKPYYLGSIRHSMLLELSNNYEALVTDFQRTVRLEHQGLDLLQFIDTTSSLPFIEEDSTVNDLLKLAFLSGHRTKFFITKQQQVRGVVLMDDFVQAADKGII